MRRKAAMTLQLECRLTEEELRRRCAALAVLAAQEEQAEEHLDEVKSRAKLLVDGAKDELDRARGAMRRMARVVNRKTEERAVDCEEYLEDDVQRALLVRTDTGVIVSSRPMTEEEKQLDIDQGEVELDAMMRRQIREHLDELGDQMPADGADEAAADAAADASEQLGRMLDDEEPPAERAEPS